MSTSDKAFCRLFLCRMLLSLGVCAFGCMMRNSLPIETLVDKLNKGDYLVRLKALEDLRELGPDAKPAIPALIKILEDENISVKGVSDAVDQEVVSSVEEANSALRASAASTLGTIGPEAKRAIPVLISKLKDDKNRFVRSACAETLAKIGVKEDQCLFALRKALADTDAVVRIDAARALAVLDPDNQDAILTIARLLQDKDADTRRSAAYSLGFIKSTRINAVVPALVKALKDSEEGVRENAAQSLGNICEASETVVPALIDRINNDRSNYVRIFVIQAIGEYGPEAKAAIPALTNALIDPDHKVRDAAAQSLDHIKTWKKRRGQKGMQE